MQLVNLSQLTSFNKSNTIKLNSACLGDESQNWVRAWFVELLSNSDLFKKQTEFS